MISRFGILECGQNYKGSATATCSACNEVDNENQKKFPFENIYSRDACTFRLAIEAINKVWNTESAHGTMRT